MKTSELAEACGSRTQALDSQLTANDGVTACAKFQLESIGVSNLLDYLRESKRGLTPEQQRMRDDFVLGILSLHVPEQVWRDAVDMSLPAVLAVDKP